MQKKYKQLATAFQKKIAGLSSNNIGLQGYHASYLDHILLHLPYYLKIYTHAFNNSSKRVEKAPGELVLLDYGCGVGLLGIFAKFCGYQKVLLCDVQQENIEAAQKISDYLGIYIDSFIYGDVDEVEKYCYQHNLKPGIVIGTDVIEHIYNLEYFFHKLHSINPAQVNVFTTASNARNPFKTRKIKKLQYRDEYTGGYTTHITKYVDVARFEEPYLFVRKKIIQELLPSVEDEVALKLAINTRGKNRPDIEAAIEKYKRDGELSSLPGDIGSNTCDPVTGSWTERLLPMSSYKKIYANAGFCLEIKNGFYNTAGTRIVKNVLAAVINRVIRYSGKAGTTISPFIQLTGYFSQ